MTAISSRLFLHPDDLQPLLDWFTTARPPQRLNDFPVLVDLREWLALPPVQAYTRLWFDGQRLVGYALVDPYNNLRFEFEPQFLTPALEEEVIRWGEACIHREMQRSGESLTLDASCSQQDTDRIAFFERHGFIQQQVRSLHLTRPLNAPIPAPQLPAGFTIRAVQGEHEVEALVALHRAAFGTRHMTVAERLAMMRVPDYDPDMDLLAVAPDGRLAGYCLCGISREDNLRSGRNEGTTDPVAVHPGFQRLGLARSLLLTGLHLLKQRGMDNAALGTSSQNDAMLRAALSVGFQIQSITLWFEKPVRL